jgi:hypothetical protein
MFPLPWLLASGLFGLLFLSFLKAWKKLDKSTKKLIIEATIKVIEEMLRNFYKWWKQRST